MDKRVLQIEGCHGCPYKKCSWSKPEGLILEGISCKHPDAPRYMSLSGVKGTHPNCPLALSVCNEEVMSDNVQLKADLEQMRTLCSELLRTAAKCAEHPYYITSFIPTVVRHALLIDTHDLFNKKGDVSGQ